MVTVEVLVAGEVSAATEVRAPSAALAKAEAASPSVKKQRIPRLIWTTPPPLSWAERGSANPTKRKETYSRPRRVGVCQESLPRRYTVYGPPQTLAALPTSDSDNEHCGIGRRLMKKLTIRPVPMPWALSTARVRRTLFAHRRRATGFEFRGSIAQQLSKMNHKCCPPAKN